MNRTQRFSRHVRSGIKHLWLRRMRSLLTMLGVVFGVASVVAMLAVGEGASAQALERLRRLGTNNIILRSEKSTEEVSSSATRSRMSIYGLTFDDHQRMRESFPAVVRTVPAKLMQKTTRIGERSLELRVVGTTPDWFDLVRRRVLVGRVMAPADIEASADVCVLTEHGARKLLATRESLGQRVRIAGQSFEVIGIVASDNVNSGGFETPDQDADVYIPLNVAQERYGNITVRRTAGSRIRERVELHLVIVEVDDSSNVETTAQGIQAMLNRFHNADDYRISVPLALLREAEATKRTFNIVLGSIAGISLLVGGIGIMNIMLASVTERTREIGVRRAIGAQRKDIIFQFLVETTVLSVLGGLIGLGVGILVPWLIETFAGMPTVVTPWSMLLALGISGAVGIVFGLYPAVRAANLDPIQALRHE